MNIHEYQAKEIFRKYGVRVLKGKVIHSLTEVPTALEEVGGNTWVVKAQIHAGGRGKGGGVKVAKSKEEAKVFAAQILGMNLITHQTGPQGKKVHKVYIEEGCHIIKEYYVACLLDRQQSRICFIASSEGGMDIEEVAQKKPEALRRIFIDPTIGMSSFHARELAYGIGLRGDVASRAIKFLLSLYKIFIEKDCSLVEINPLVVTREDEVIALDAKVNFDDNAIYRHPELLELRDISEEDPSEIEASKYDLSFIKLDGSIGCLVNGAGLAMATMDIIKLHGGEPANFLDVGGGADKKKVTEAFKIILQDPKVKAVLVNIFGGIMKCDIIAEGVIAASKELGLKVPLVVRLEGTNVQLGKKLLSDSGLNIITADNLTDAAKKVVAAVGR